MSTPSRRPLCLVVGTRPDIVKMSPVIRALTKARAEFEVLHSAQHTLPEMDAAFFRDLGLAPASRRLARVARSKDRRPGHLLGVMMADFEDVFSKTRPRTVVVQGDTHSAFAGALAAAHLGIPVAHVEAGLRSHDRTMPEELNRVLADHLADLLFAPTAGAAAALRREGLPHERIFVTGNTVVDAVRQNLGLARRRSDAMARLALRRRGFILLTLHRAENLNSLERLRGILRGVERVAETTGLPIILPLHPSLGRVLRRRGLRLPRDVRATAPLGYLDFLALEAQARLALTDSGGVQEETTVLGVPCVTLRDNTERPESVKVGANILAGTDPDRILAAVNRMLGRTRKWRNPFGDGRAGARIARILLAKGRRSGRHLG